LICLIRDSPYEELREVIGRYGGHGPNLKDIGKFMQAASRAQFLFGSEVTEFLEHRRLDLHREFVARERDPQPIPEARRKAAEDEYAARLNRLLTSLKTLIYWSHRT
jgi:hypothetical protein